LAKLLKNGTPKVYKDLPHGSPRPTQTSSRRTCWPSLRPDTAVADSRVSTFAADFVPEHLRASGVGWYSTTVGVMQLIASLIAGALWKLRGHESVFSYGALFAVLGGLVLVSLVPTGLRP
jgi:hypothetical protein